MPSPPSLYSLPSAPGTPTSFESACEESVQVGRGPKVLNGRLVKSKPRQPTQPLPPSALVGSPSPLAEGTKDQSEDQDDNDNDDNHDNDNDNHLHLNATKEPRKHTKLKDSRDREVKLASGNKIWKLMKRISTGGLRDKYALHSPSFSMSSPSGKVSGVVGGGGGGIGGPTRSLSRAAPLRVTKLSNYSEESLALSHQSQGSYGSVVASSSHTSHASHGESLAGPVLLASASAFHDHTPPPPVPAIPKDLQIPQNHHLQTPNVLLLPSVASSPSSPASLSFSEPGSNMSRNHHRRDRDSRSASSPIPSISSPLSPGQFSSTSYSSTSYSSSPPPQTPSPSPSAPSKKRILSRISSMGLLRRKPSIASGLASSLGIGATAPDKVEKKNENDEEAKTEATQGDSAAQEVPASFTIPNIPSIPSTPPSKVSKPKPTKYSISCIPIPSIPSMPSMSIIASSTPSTPTKSTTTTAPISISFSSSSSRPGTGKTTLSQSSSASSPRLSLDSRSRSHSRSMGMLATQGGRKRSRSMSRSRSRSSSADSLGRRPNHAHTTPTRNNKNSNHHQDRNNNHNHNHNTVPTPALTNPYPLDKHIVPPLELSATLSGEDDNRWGVEHVLSGDAGTNNSSVSLPAIDIHGHSGQTGNSSLSYPEPPLCRRDKVSVDMGHGPKRANNRSINTRSTGSKDDRVEKVSKREERMDKWERLLERRDKLELDKLDGLKSRSTAGRESWTIVRSPEPEELPSLPVPPRKRTKEREGRREKEKEKGTWERSASMDVPVSSVSSSPVYRGRTFVDDIPAPSTFGRVMGKQIGAKGNMEENRRSSLSPIQGRASFSVVGDDARKNERDGSRKRRSLSAVRSPSALVFSKDVVPSPRSWTKSLSSPILRKNSDDAADPATVVSTITPPTPAPAPVVATPPRALGTLFRKLSFSGGSANTEKRRNRSPRRPSTASSISSTKARSVSIISGGKAAFFWNSDHNKQGELDTPSSSLPRRLLRKNSLLKGRSNGNQDIQDKLPTRTRRRPRTADDPSSASNSTLTEKEKRERWENLLEKSEKAGGTIHLRANGEGLLSDRMRMSMVSTASELSGGTHVGVQEE